MKTIVEPRRRLPVSHEADVVVAGSGVSGVSAAVASSRAGAKTLLIERYGFPGGTSTAGLMSGITNFFFTRMNKHVARGIAQEIIDRLVEKKGVGLGPFTKEVPQIPNDPEKMKLVLIELLEDAGVNVLYHTYLADTQVVGGHIQSAIIENKAGRSAVNGKVFVDATGDADLIHMSNGRVESVGANGSLEMRMANVELDRLLDYFLLNPSEYDEFGDVETSLKDFKRNWKEKGIFHLPHGNGRKMSIVQNAIVCGEYPREFGLVHGMDAFGMYGLRGTRTVIVNTGFIHGDLLDPFFLSRAETDARRAAAIASDFLVNRIPGFEDAYLADTAAQIGIRQTRRIVGHYTLTQQECESFSRFNDVVAVGTERKIGGPRYEGGFDMPYRIMIPQGIEGILVASGKSVSTDPPGFLRGQVACMQMGQASGVAAAISALSKTVPSEIEIGPVQRELLRQGVYLGDGRRLSELGLT